MIDWSTASAIVASVVSVVGFLWGIVTYKDKAGKKKTDDEGGEDDRILTLEKWRIEVTAAVEQLRRDIEHVRETSDTKDEATNERLRRMEDKLDELLDLLISLVKERT